ncbi:MAG: D-ribose ABC transporter substrate-binding protein [Eubacteriales bacterium]|nr:D-ribose ABC transporter substrate-binding protein [Eubacteriales bacterium]
MVGLFTLAVGCAGETEEPAKTEGTEAPSGTVGTEAPSGDQPRIGLSVSTLNNPFFVTLTEGAQSVADANGAELVVLDANDDVAKQVSDIEDLVQQEVDVIIINATDGDGVVSAVETANRAGIPVIAIDRSINGGEITSHIASNNVYGGEIAAKFILEKLGGSGKVAEIQGVQGASATIERYEGFHKIMEAEAGIEIVASQAADFDRAKGLTTMENILQSQPELDAVFAHNDEMVLGALEAIEGSGRDLIVVGFDGIDDAYDAIREGRLDATVEEQAGPMGELGVETALKIINGEEVPASIPLDVRLMTIDDLD